MLVDAANSMFAELIRTPLHQKPLIEAIRTATGKPYRVGVFKSSLRAAKEEKKDDPFDALLRSAMDGGVPVEEKTGPDKNGAGPT